MVEVDLLTQLAVGVGLLVLGGIVSITIGVKIVAPKVIALYESKMEDENSVLRKISDKLQRKTAEGVRDEVQKFVARELHAIDTQIERIESRFVLEISELKKTVPTAEFVEKKIRDALVGVPTGDALELRIRTALDGIPKGVELDDRISTAINKAWDTQRDNFQAAQDQVLERVREEGEAISSKVEDALAAGAASFLGRRGADAQHDQLVEEGVSELEGILRDPRNAQLQVGKEMVLELGKALGWKTNKLAAVADGLIKMNSLRERLVQAQQAAQRFGVAGGAPFVGVQGRGGQAPVPSWIRR